MRDLGQNEGKRNTENTMSTQRETRIEKIDRLRKEKKAAWLRETEARENRDRIARQLATKREGDAALSAALELAKEEVTAAWMEHQKLTAKFNKACSAR